MRQRSRGAWELGSRKEYSAFVYAHTAPCSPSPLAPIGVSLSHFPSVDLDLVLDLELDVVVDPFLFV